MSIIYPFYMYIQYISFIILKKQEEAEAPSESPEFSSPLSTTAKMKPKKAKYQRRFLSQIFTKSSGVSSNKATSSRAARMEPLKAFLKES